MLRSLLDTAALLAPERAVLTVDGAALTLAELAGRADALATVIREHDADSVVLLVENGPVLPLTLFAAATAGVPAVPLNYRLPDADLHTLIGHFTRPLVVVDPAQVGRLEHHLLTDEWVRTQRPAAEPAFTDPETTAVILFTSGTTSAPKPVPLSHSNLGTYVLNTLDLCSADESEAALISVPPYHVAGVSSALTNVLSGRRMAYLPRFTPQGWLDVITHERVTTAMVVPTMLAQVVEALGDTPFTGALRSLSYGGAPTAPSVLRKALKLFPDVGFTNAYGLTETSSTLALLTPDEHRAALTSDDPLVQARLASVGRPVPGVEAQVRAEDGTVLGPDSPGILWVRGEQVSGRYIGRDSALDADGWFCTRDGARIDPDGYVFILGRTDDTIIRGGENVAPAEIEAVLTDHPAVRDAGVVGIPDEQWGQRIAAVLVADEIDVDDFTAWCRGRLRSSRTPDVVVLADELPYGPTGKLLRHHLLDLVLEPTTTDS